ncbi:peptidoglycan DD-metalloendopeptidase family protein [Alkaliphilus crotonatoxidans]
MNQRFMKHLHIKFNLYIRKASLKTKNIKLLLQQALYNAKRAYYKLSPQNRKKYTIIAASIVSILMIALLTNQWMNNTLRAYEVIVDGQVIGVVREEEDFWQAVEIAQDEIKTIYHQEIDLSEDVVLKSTKADDEALTKEAYIINNIKRLMNIQIKAVAIMVNGEEVTLVKDMETAEAVLAALKEPYINADQDYEAVDFKESVELVGVMSSSGVIRDKEDAINLITNGTDEVKIHEVQNGENTWVIARNHDLTVEDIQKANPDLNPEKLKIGQEISLVVPKPYVTVLTKEYVEMVETVPYETVYEETDSLYEGDKKIIAQGEEGSREIKGYLIKENGVEVDREILEEKVLAEPQIRVVAEGTKARPKTMATGVFANPSRGTLTSRFGSRWGSMHTGIDIANKTGTPIYAADGGKVSFSGSNGAYGNLVIIDHENGYQTYYAHCSKLLVSKGDRVYKGQHIANVGNTGRSTGPHLHFEVRKNGTPINPLGYVKY